MAVLGLLTFYALHPAHAQSKKPVKCAKWIANLSDGTVQKSKGKYRCFKKIEHALAQGFVIPGSGVSGEPTPSNKTVLTGVGNGTSKTVRLTRFPVLMSYSYSCPKQDFGSGDVILRIMNLKTGQSGCLDNLCVPTTQPLKTRLITTKITDPLRITAEASDPACKWEVTFEEGV